MIDDGIARNRSDRWKFESDEGNEIRPRPFFQNRRIIEYFSRKKIDKKSQNV